mgnify:CR=1 FL=1
MNDSRYVGKISIPDLKTTTRQDISMATSYGIEKLKSKSNLMSEFIESRHHTEHDCEVQLRLCYDTQIVGWIARLEISDFGKFDT